MYENVYTSTQLKTNLREIKEAAEKDIVYITENGVIAYVLCSVEIWNREMERAEREGEWEVAVEFALRDAEHDQSEGNVKSLGEGLYMANSFKKAAQELDFSWRVPEILGVIEYVSSAPSVGREVPDRVPRWKQDGWHARTFCCGGYDLVYEYDTASGEVLLCGLVESLDSFE